MSDTHCGVFISHAHEDKKLAEAWQQLLQAVTMARIDPWRSSDDRARGGMEYGEDWRKKIEKKLLEAETILVLVTPTSNEKPWVFWESGLARGKAKELIPVFYFMKAEMVHSIFQSQQLVNGDDEEAVNRLCAQLVGQQVTDEIPPSVSQLWPPLLAKYIKQVREERERSFDRRLFHDHFHDRSAAEQLAGTWYAKWTQQHDDGQEEDIFEVDRLTVWTTESRLRLVGVSSKLGRETLTEQGRKDAYYYPMEGVVSRNGYIALSYWSGGRIPICGTTLLEPKGSAGELLEGTWQGFTARNINDAPAYTRGRVVMSRSERIAEEYWRERTASA